MAVVVVVALPPSPRARPWAGGQARVGCKSFPASRLFFRPSSSAPSLFTLLDKKVRNWYGKRISAGRDGK